MEYTFEQLPKAIAILHDKLEAIERLLGQKPIDSFQSDELLTVQGATEFLSLSVPTIYGLISKGNIPVMKRSKRCYFSKSDLFDYLKEGRKSSLAEINDTAEKYLKRQTK